MDFNSVVGKLYPQRAKGVEADKLPWNDPNYTFQVKKDGDRRLLYFTKDGVLNTSRSKGADTGLPVDKTNNVPHIRDLNKTYYYLEGTILDVEFIHNRGFQEGVRKIMGCLPEKAIQRQNEWGLIEVYVFDIIYYKGESLVDKPLKDRMELLKTLYNLNFKDIPFFHLVETVEGTQEKFQELVFNGEEGMVAKRIDSTYRLSTEKCLTPLKNAWIKIKKEFNGDFVVMGFDEPTKEYTGDHLDTHPYFERLDTGEKWMVSYEMGKRDPRSFVNSIPVTKYHAMGWIGGIKFGEYENGILVERGTVSGMDEKTRAEISANPNDYIGKVIEIDAMERIKKTKALRQPVFKQFRDDKLPEECIYDNQKG